MSLIKYEPATMLNRRQNDLNDFFQRMDNFFPSLFNDNQLLEPDWKPRVDIHEDDREYIVTADIPGVDPKDIEVTLASGVISIKGKRELEKEENKKNFYRKECLMGSFERTFHLPDTIDESRVKAKGKNGVLTIRIEKRPAAKAKSIKIEAEH